MRTLSLVFLFIEMTLATLAAAERPLAEVRSVDDAIASVQLTDAGNLWVTKNNGTQSVTKLSKANADILSLEAFELNAAEVVVEKVKVTCYMMINPLFITSVRVWDSETGNLRDVLTLHSCGLPTYTHPTQDYLQRVVEQLQDQLLALARQFAD